MFQDLTIEDRIDLCNRCQNILGQSFPNSEYTLTKENLDKGIEFYKNLIDSFNGEVFRCEEGIIFFKKNMLENPRNKQAEFLRIVKGPHFPKGNCLFIHFMAAHIGPHNAKELESFFFDDQRVEYIMAARRGAIFLETKETLRARAQRIQNSEKFISSLAL